MSAHQRLQQRQLLGRAVASLQAGELDAAEAALRALLLRWPGHGDALHFQGLLRHRQGRSDAAIVLLQQATAALPDEPGPWNNLGNVLSALQRWADAERAYRAALALQPDHADALANLANACRRQERPEEAAALYRRALALAPGNALWQHLLAACDPTALPERASDGYLQQVFDQAASTFDGHLGSLQYQAPERLAAAVARLCGAPAAALDVGDLGCGTGLCAPGLRPYARVLLGCDLSAGMLAQARQRGLYDTLVQEELQSFLDARPAAFDLLACADTLIYFGDLGPVLGAAARALRPGGRMVFSIEALADDDTAPVRLLPHGRFAHRADHVAGACGAAGLVLDPPEPFVLRFEAGRGVAGWLGVAQRPPAGASPDPATRRENS